MDVQIHRIVLTCSNQEYLCVVCLAVPGKAIKYLEHPNRMALAQDNLSLSEICIQ